MYCKFQTNWLRQHIRCLLFENRPVTKLFVVSHKVDKFKCDTVAVPRWERSVCCWCASTCAHSSLCIEFNRQANTWRSHPLSYSSYMVCSFNTHNAYVYERFISFRFVVLVMPFLFCVRTMYDRDSNIRFHIEEKVRASIRHHLTLDVAVR